MCGLDLEHDVFVSVCALDTCECVCVSARRVHMQAQVSGVVVHCALGVCKCWHLHLCKKEALMCT